SRLQGIVLDARTKQPLAGAVLKIKGTTHAVCADQDGKFTINTGQAFPYTLQISYIGYTQKETVVDGTPVTIQLEENQVQLSDIVVTGYSTQQRKYIASSISSVSGKIVQDQPSGGFN